MAASEAMIKSSDPLPSTSTIVLVVLSGETCAIAELRKIFWLQAYGSDKSEFLAQITDKKTRKFAEINYGPWDRLNNDKPFLNQVNKFVIHYYFLN